VGDPSSTRLLADRLVQRSFERFMTVGVRPGTDVIALAPLAVGIAQALVAGFPGKQVQEAIDRLARADAVIAATPVYKAGVSGLFKSFLDLIDNDLLIATPVILSATAGSARHAMVPDEQMRPLFAFLRALPVPTSVFAAPEDWAGPDLGKRIDRAATELVHLVQSGTGRAIADEAWGGYQHQFGGNATRAERNSTDIDFDTGLMRLAAGGSLASLPEGNATERDASTGPPRSAAYPQSSKCKSK
jgi:FMN reductase